jgi:hypothetical protein
MPEQWIVRVQGKEYGPVDLEELREWRRDGRLIRENEVREEDSERWFPAAELPEVFADEVAPAPPPVVRQRTFGEIVAASWRIYRQGFWRFFALALLVSTPSFFLQVAAPSLQMPAKGGPIAVVVVSALVAFTMLVLLIIAWPFSIGGLQILAADILSGRDPGFRDVLARAKPLWTRMFTLGLIVYASYFLWTVIPLLVALSLTASASAGGLLIMLLLLIFTAYMVARLFINFLFWQQAGALGGNDAMDALRESKDLARSGADLPRLQRPLYRGAIIASVWLLVIIIVNLGIELPAMMWRLRGVTSLEQALPLVQSMATSSSFDVLSALTTFVSCLVSAVLRGWLAASFVVLYLETKASTQLAKRGA